MIPGFFKTGTTSLWDETRLVVSICMEAWGNFLKISNGGLQEGWRGTFARACNDRIQGNGFKLKESRLILV